MKTELLNSILNIRFGLKRQNCSCHDYVSNIEQKYLAIKSDELYKRTTNVKGDEMIDFDDDTEDELNFF